MRELLPGLRALQAFLKESLSPLKEPLQLCIKLARSSNSDPSSSSSSSSSAAVDSDSWLSPEQRTRLVDAVRELASCSANDPWLPIPRELLTAPLAPA